jgi:hypothetical protein
MARKYLQFTPNMSDWTLSIMTQQPKAEIQHALGFWTTGHSVSIGTVAVNLSDKTKVDVNLIVDKGTTKTFTMSISDFNTFLKRKRHLWLERDY